MVKPLKEAKGEPGKGEVMKPADASWRKGVSGPSVSVVTVRSRGIGSVRPFRFLFWRVDISVVCVFVCPLFIQDQSGDPACSQSATARFDRICVVFGKEMRRFRRRRTVSHFANQVRDQGII